MSRSYTERDAALAIDCEVCDQCPGEACVDEEGTYVAVHQERMEELHARVMLANETYNLAGISP